MGSRRECTRVLGLGGSSRSYYVDRDGAGCPSAIAIERRGSGGFECSGCRRRVRDRDERTWGDLPVVDYARIGRQGVQRTVDEPKWD